MNSAHKLLSAFALAALCATATASPVVYNTSLTFLAHVLPGAYTETFDGLAGTPPGAAPFSGGAFSYTISAPSDTYATGDFLSTSLPGEALTINFTSGNVRAIGANFFATNINPDFQSVLVSLRLSDGTVEAFTPASYGDSYRGFIFDSAITSMTVSASGRSLYATLDNLTVGTVPEPASLALVGLAFAGLGLARRRSGR